MMTKHLMKIPMLIVALTLTHPLASLAQDAVARGAAVLNEARKAIGGEDKLRGVKALQVKGDVRRSMGPMQVDGELEILLDASGKYRRDEALNLPNGATAVRTEVLNGEDVWDDSSTRGGMGGGMQIVMGRGPAGETDPARLKEMQRRMRRVDLGRHMLAWLLTTDAPVTHAGVAEAPDGKADVLEIKPAEGPAMRLFIDQQTHMPLMLTWRAPQPRVMMRGGPGGGPGGPGGPASPAPGAAAPHAGAGAAGHGAPPPEAAARQVEAGPGPEVTMEMRFSEYKKVDGIQLPHVISRGAAGETNEEWTIKSYKVNPSFKANTFTK